MVDSLKFRFYSDSVAAPKGLIGKSVECRRAPRHCREAEYPSMATATAGRPMDLARDASESGDRPRGRALRADIVPLFTGC